ncbi:MAG: glutamate racemase [Chloroflexi bacterium]|nr:glutamate racemase [Chloroflexota bacterium]MCL5276131.1 glutamate racemase [Chloroflexota bacterium]
MIGVFDSGVGGLSVWREIVRLMPDEPILYLADQAHVPYGARTLDDVRALTTRSIAWLIRRGCSMVVIACNTASAAALQHVREVFPRIPFVGMEPAVKPAASHTRTGVIGVLATQATFHSELFASVVMRHAAGVKVIEQPCAGWVELVEGADGAVADPPAGTALVDRYVLPLLDAGADTLVLGCTHFPFLAASIRHTIARWQSAQAHPRDVELVDPSLAVARQTMRVRDKHNLSAAVMGVPLRRFCTTGDADAFNAVARRLLREQPALQTGLQACHVAEADIMEIASESQRM